MATNENDIPGQPDLSQVQATIMETLQQALSNRPVQTLAKVAAAVLPVAGDLEIGGANAVQRLAFELNLSEEEVKGREVEKILLDRFREQQAAVEREQRQAREQQEKAANDFLSRANKAGFSPDDMLMGLMERFDIDPEVALQKVSEVVNTDLTGGLVKKVDDAVEQGIGSLFGTVATLKNPGRVPSAAAKLAAKPGASVLQRRNAELALLGSRDNPLARFLRHLADSGDR